MSTAENQTRKSLFIVDERTKKRNASEARFRAFGLSAILVAVFCLLLLAGSILSNGLGAFQQTFVTYDVLIDPDIADPKGNRDPAEMSKVTTLGYGKLVSASLMTALEAAGISTDGPGSEKEIGSGPVGE